MKLLLNPKAQMIKDVNNPYSDGYIYDNHRYYLEPVFKTKLETFLSIHHNLNHFDLIKQEMAKIVDNNSTVIFTGDFNDEKDTSITNYPGAIYLDFRDILDICHLKINDISRGSDYGD